MLASTLGLVATLLVGGAVGQLGDVTPPKDSPLDLMPRVGLGTFSINRDIATRKTWSEKETIDIIAGAIGAGYRHLDTAAIYQNEKIVGQGIAEGIKRSGLKRSNLWVTTKIW
jgi:alcohol dehydrogenase (NADP+)